MGFMRFLSFISFAIDFPNNAGVVLLLCGEKKMTDWRMARRKKKTVPAGGDCLWVCVARRITCCFLRRTL